MPTTALVAFDLDGTLVDTPTAIVRTFVATFEAIGAPPVDQEAIRATIGIPLGRAVSGLLGLPETDDLVRQGVKQYQVIFRETVVPTSADLLFPGVRAGLRALRDAGHVLAIATSKYHANAMAMLVAADIADLFTMVVGSDQVERPKPDPATGLLITRELGVPAHESTMVGDTSHDILMAKAAGMRSIGVTFGVHSRAQLTEAGADTVVDTFPAVVAALA